MPLPPKFPQTDVLHTWLQYSNGRTHNKNEQNFRWLAGFQACPTWAEPDLGVTLPSIYASIYFWVTVDIQVRSGLAATKVSFACGCELAAVDRGQESHLLSKITPSYRLKHHPARQGQKTKIKVFCRVWWGFTPPHSLISHNMIQNKFLKFYFKNPSNLPWSHLSARDLQSATYAMKEAALHEVCSRLDNGAYSRGGWFEFQFEKTKVLFWKLLQVFHLEDMKGEIW